ncbi:unnamed protein product [Calypogeia fissa]
MADKLMASCTTSCSSTNLTMRLLSQTTLRSPLHYNHSPSSSSSSVASCSSPSPSYTTLRMRKTAIVIPRAASGQTARVTCFFGGEKRDAARKALESALGEKKEAFSKWDEEIKKREAGGSGSPPKGRGRGWGGGGGGDKGGGDNLSEGSEGGGFQAGEALQVVYAFAGLASLYLVLTQGSRMVAFVLNGLLFVSRGFRPRPKPRYAPVEDQLPGRAESHVKSKWGSDD